MNPAPAAAGKNTKSAVALETVRSIYPMRKELVGDILLETGDDVILSFWCISPDDWDTGYSIILMRTPKYEFILEEWERRPSLSHEEDYDDTDQYLLSAQYHPKENRLILEGTRRSYELHLRKVGSKELKQMKRGFKLLNFDQAFEFTAE